MVMSVKVELEGEASPSEGVEALMEEWMAMVSPLLLLWVKWILASIETLTLFCTKDEKKTK